MTKNSNEFRGYESARAIDELVNSLVKDYPLCDDNVLQWLAFSRTIETTGHVLHEMAKEHVRNMRLSDRQEHVTNEILSNRQVKKEEING